MKRKIEKNLENASGNGDVKEVSYDLKLKALELFRYGYKKVSSQLGIKLYTARYWGRRFHKGDEIIQSQRHWVKYIHRLFL